MTRREAAESQLTDGERDWFENFSCTQVQCTKPCDRADVLGQIRDELGLRGGLRPLCAD